MELKVNSIWIEKLAKLFEKLYQYNEYDKPIWFHIKYHIVLKNYI